MAKHNKKYSTLTELIERFNIFQENYAFVMSHDSQLAGYELGLNYFSDWTQEELSNLYSLQVNEDSIHESEFTQQITEET